MKTALAALAALSIASAAGAQVAQSSLFDDGAAAPAAVDEGRPVINDRDGLSTRGGPDPTGASKTFSERIGTPIYSPVNTPIKTQNAAPR